MPFTIEKKIEKVIHEIIRPQLKDHYGDIDFVSFDEGIAKVSFKGACRGCPSAHTTLEGVVKKALTEKLDLVVDVVAVNPVSDDLMDLAKKILGRHR